MSAVREMYSLGPVYDLNAKENIQPSEASSGSQINVGPMKKQQQQEGRLKRQERPKEITKRWKHNPNFLAINTQPLPNLVGGLGGPSNMMDFMLQSNMEPNEGAGPSNLSKKQRKRENDEELVRAMKKNKNNLVVAEFPLSKKAKRQEDFVSFSKKKKVKRLRDFENKPVKNGLLNMKYPITPGDWTCSCGNYNLAWRAQCSQCKNLREAQMGEVLAPKPPKPIQNVGPTMFVPEGGETVQSGLRPIVIDGSNVAMAHGRHVTFSPKGIEICINYFKKRGHTTIVAFLPQYRQGHDGELFNKLEKEGHVIFTPSRNVQGVRLTSYDDRFIIEYAHGHGGVIVSRDNYRDILEEKPEWREPIEERLLMPTWVGDTIMFPSDPLGSDGPTLDQFLKF